MTLCKEISITHTTMKNVPNKKGWMTRMTQPHVESKLIPLTEENHDW